MDAGSTERRPIAWLVAGMLVLLFAYGAFSTPELIERWGVGASGIALAGGWIALAACALPLIRTRPSRRFVAILFVLGIVIRSAFATLVAARAPHGDAQSYLALADNLLAGRGLVIVEPFLGVSTRALFPPLYPVLLAGWAIGFGLSTVSLLLFNTLIDIAAAAVIVAIGKRIGSAGAGRGAAWLYLVWPSVLLSAPLAQKEGLCSLLILILALGWLWREKGLEPRRIAAIGTAAGLLALTQPGEAALAALFGLVLAGRSRWRDAFRIGLPAAGVACLVLLPWTVRNWLVLGAFVPLTTAGGISLWIGNNADATGNWMPPPRPLHGLPEIAYGRHAAAIAQAWIAAHPVEFARLTLAKFVRACGVGEFGLVRMSAMHPALSAAATAILFPLSHGVHLAMLGAGAWAARCRDDAPTRAAVLLVAACGLQLLIFGVWFEFGERHREFATPFLLLLICVAAARIRPPRCRRPDEAV